MGIDEYILRTLKISLADSRISFIKQKGRIILQIPDDKNLEIFKQILDFYSKRDHTKDEIENFSKNVNKLLNIYKDKTTNQEIKKIATVFMSSLSFARAIKKNQAAHLDNTEMVLYKGHDVKGASGTHVKNMDIGGSAWISDEGTTHFYMGKEKGDISLKRKEVKQIINLAHSLKLYREKLDKSNMRLMELEDRLNQIKGTFIGFRTFFQKAQINVEKMKNKYYKGKIAKAVKEPSTERQINNNL